MNNFDEYLRQGEPSKAEKAKDWKTAIGLQQIDGLKPSGYLIETAKQNIEGEISIQEVKLRIESYYKQHPSTDNENRTEEADKVSARITEILSEKTFTFSPSEYLTIHRRLFKDIYNHAGKIRDYNITKQEWVLNGETVLYATAESLNATLEFDFKQEKQFNYRGLNQFEIIEHLAHFISYLWQIHVFGEGNTRTTAIFLIKYLRKLGYKDVNNEMFASYSWFFRNALVRANYEDLSKNIYKNEIYLIRFLRNLLLHENNILKNRELHIHFNHYQNDTVKLKNDTVNEPLFSLIKENNQITAIEISTFLNISLSTAKRRIKLLKDRGLIERIGSDKTGYWKIMGSL
ncbi:MAG: cell filamentation protein Fic [Bacteroidetes bacterium]|nr:cell filamentation protein Fic [Bacteroidota bacterium]